MKQVAFKFRLAEGSQPIPLTSGVLETNKTEIDIDDPVSWLNPYNSEKTYGKVTKMDLFQDEDIVYIVIYVQ